MDLGPGLPFFCHFYIKRLNWHPFQLFGYPGLVLDETTVLTRCTIYDPFQTGRSVCIYRVFRKRTWVLPERVKMSQNWSFLAWKPVKTSLLAWKPVKTSHFLAWKPVISWHLARNQSLWLRNLALGTWYPSGVLSIGCSVCHGYTVPVPAACRSQYHRAAPVSRQKVLRQASFVFCGR